MIEHPTYDYYDKTVKQTTTFLKRWNGGTAIFHELTVSHKALYIRVYRQDREGWFLQIACSAPEWMQGQCTWESCNIQIAGNVNIKGGKTGFILSDENSGLEIHTVHLESSEHSPKN